MKNLNKIFEDTYLNNYIFESSKVDQKKVKENNFQSDPIDDLTKENTITIEESPEDPEELDNSSEFNSSEELNNNDGWPDEWENDFEETFSALDNFVYEIRNCTKGAYTNCKTIEELKTYINETLIPQLENMADSI